MWNEVKNSNDIICWYDSEEWEDEDSFDYDGIKTIYKIGLENN